jgi:hypothetical protein
LDVKEERAMTERQKLQIKYAAYANHAAIQRKVPKTWRTWLREQRPGAQEGK